VARDFARQYFEKSMILENIEDKMSVGSRAGEKMVIKLCQWCSI
jgi:hypothetical protein